MNTRGLRRRLDRAARTYDASAPLDAEIGARMLERLAYMRVSPSRVLDAGAGTGRDARALAKVYPRAGIFALDLSPGMLRAARGAQGLLARLRGRGPRAVCADIASMPLAAGSMDVVWSNLALHWCEDPARALGEFARVLLPGGLLMFSCYGPDTFAELGDARTRRYADMHDLGDMLVGCGFADPVMDMERLDLTYADVDAFFADLRATAQATPRRGGGLGGRRRIAALRSALEARRGNERLSIGIEIVYGHAWKSAQRRTAEGHAAVSAAVLKRARR